MLSAVGPTNQNKIFAIDADAKTTILWSKSYPNKATAAAACAFCPNSHYECDAGDR